MIYIILSRVGHSLFSTQRLLMSPMLLSCVYHYKWKGFHFKSLKFLKQGRLGGGELRVCIQVLRESTASSAISAPGSCCIPAGAASVQPFISKAIARAGGECLMLYFLSVRIAGLWSGFQLHFHGCGATQIDVPHTVCLRGQRGNAKPTIRPVRHSTHHHQFNELQNKAHSHFITRFR